VWMVEACAWREQRSMHRTGGPPMQPPPTPPLNHYCCCCCYWGCPCRIGAAKAASGVPQRTRARQMQAAEVVGTAACPARKHLLLALMHATGAHDSLCTNRLQTFAKFVPSRFCWRGRVAQSFAKFLQTFVDRSVVNATGLFCQTFAPTALL